MTIKVRRIILILTAFLLILLIGVLGEADKNESEYEIKIKLQQPEFLLEDSPDINSVSQCIKYYGIHHENIVLAQAILETGYFRSRICKEYNNLFGLYNSKSGSYYRYDHWSESIIAYREYIQHKYKEGENYYKFLKRINYAEDTLYINKLKKIIDKYEFK